MQEAIDLGVLNVTIDDAIISIGGNDYRQLKWAQFKPNVRRIVAMIRQEAPYARVTIVSKLPLSQNNQVCLANGLPALFFPPIEISENIIHDTQKSLAEELGTNWIDIKELAKDHATCAAQPYTAIFDNPFKDEGYLFALHPTQPGADFVARTLKERL